MIYLVELALKVEATRNAWHEKYGVPVSQEHAEFMFAIGQLIDAVREDDECRDE